LRSFRSTFRAVEKSAPSEGWPPAPPAATVAAAAGATSDWVTLPTYQHWSDVEELVDGGTEASVSGRASSGMIIEPCFCRACVAIVPGEGGLAALGVVVVDVLPTAGRFCFSSFDRREERKDGKRDDLFRGGLGWAAPDFLIVEAWVGLGGGRGLVCTVWYAQLDGRQAKRLQKSGVTGGVPKWEW
jgi:hypothetical protein